MCFAGMGGRKGVCAVVHLAMSFVCLLDLKVLQSFRKKWRSAAAHVVDEFSFLAPGTFSRLIYGAGLPLVSETRASEDWALW